MRPQIKVARKDVAQIVNATFPEYKGRKIRIEATTEATLFDLNWSGGSRSQYRTCTLTGEPVGSADRFNHMHPWYHDGEGKSVPIPAGAVMVRHSIFMGKDSGLTIYVNPKDMPALLPAPKDDPLDDFNYVGSRHHY